MSPSKRTRSATRSTRSNSRASKRAQTKAEEVDDTPVQEAATLAAVPETEPTETIIEASDVKEQIVEDLDFDLEFYNGVDILATPTSLNIPTTASSIAEAAPPDSIEQFGALNQAALNEQKITSAAAPKVTAISVSIDEQPHPTALLASEESAVLPEDTIFTKPAENTSATWSHSEQELFVSEFIVPSTPVTSEMLTAVESAGSLIEKQALLGMYWTIDDMLKRSPEIAKHLHLNEAGDLAKVEVPVDGIRYEVTWKVLGPEQGDQPLVDQKKVFPAIPGLSVPTSSMHERTDQTFIEKKESTSLTGPGLKSVNKQGTGVPSASIIDPEKENKSVSKQPSASITTKGDSSSTVRRVALENKTTNVNLTKLDTNVKSAASGSFPPSVTTTSAATKSRIIKSTPHCKYGNRCTNPNCVYDHTPKPKLCTFVNTPQGCTNGPSCAHSHQQLGKTCTVGRFRSTCALGSRCAYKHDDDIPDPGLAHGGTLALPGISSSAALAAAQQSRATSAVSSPATALNPDVKRAADGGGEPARKKQHVSFGGPPPPRHIANYNSRGRGGAGFRGNPRGGSRGASRGGPRGGRGRR